MSSAIACGEDLGGVGEDPAPVVDAALAAGGVGA
jgi:hypothetical protein